MTGFALAALAAAEEPFVRWGWIGDHLDDVWDRTVEHVQLTVVAVLIGLAISAVLAAVAIRFPWAYGPIAGLGNVLYTIPSLALFGFLVPYTHLGFLTAQIALVSYTILILVRNIVEGIVGVPAAVREAADGMGYTRLRRLVQVELPLALPTIVTGLRIASVTVVGLVTVTALIGAGGYGVFIEDGLRRQFPTPIVLGTVLSVLLAAVVDGLLALAQRLLTPWQRRARVA